MFYVSVQTKVLLLLLCNALLLLYNSLCTHFLKYPSWFFFPPHLPYRTALLTQSSLFLLHISVYGGVPPWGSMCVSLFFFPHKLGCCITAVAFLYSEFYSWTKNLPPKKDLTIVELGYEDAKPNVCCQVHSTWRSELREECCCMTIDNSTLHGSFQTNRLRAEAAQYCLCHQFNDTKTSKVGKKCLIHTFTQFG